MEGLNSLLLKSNLHLRVVDKVVTTTRAATAATEGVCRMSYLNLRITA